MQHFKATLKGNTFITTVIRSCFTFAPQQVNLAQLHCLKTLFMHGHLQGSDSSVQKNHLKHCFHYRISEYLSSCEWCPKCALTVLWNWNSKKRTKQASLSASFTMPSEKKEPIPEKEKNTVLPQQPSYSPTSLLLFLQADLPLSALCFLCVIPERGNTL